MPENASPQGTLLGLDFGFRRIGVAVGQTTTRTGNPLTVIAHGSQPDWASLDKVVNEWQPKAFVVGLPLGKEGQATPLSDAARGFGKALHKRYARQVYYMDERLTSQAAGSDFAARRASGQARRKDAAKLDAVAANIILENWLQSLPA